MTRGNYLAASLVIALLALSGCGAGNTVVAQIGREPITSAALDHWVAVEVDLEGIPYVEPHVVLGNLIALHWILAEADEYGLHVSSAEARKQLTLLSYARRSDTQLNVFPDEAALQHLLTSTKLTDADRVWLVSIEMLSPRILRRLAVQAEPTIGRKQLAGFFHANRPSFLVPEKRDIEMFMTKDWATAARGKREIQAGKNFQSVAKRLNVSFEAHGGLVMGLAKGAGEVELEEHVFRAKPHVLLGPVKQVLTYVFRVTKVYPQHLQRLAQVERSIRRRLAARAASTVLRPALQQRWRARTSCRSRYVVAQCNEYSRIAKGRLR